MPVIRSTNSEIDGGRRGVNDTNSAEHRHSHKQKKIRIEKERKEKKNYHLNVLNDSCCFVALLCSQAWTDRDEMENDRKKKWKRIRKLKMPN